nr:DNA methyltransferase [Methanobrevibacter smithii]
MTLEEYWESTGRTLKFIRRLPNKTGKNGGVQYWVRPSDTSLRTSNWTDLEVSQIAKEYDLPFENPKNVDLIETIISAFSGNDFIILDFFSGTSTTADAVFRINNKDNGNRKFIMVQIPTLSDEKSDAYKKGFKNICEIGKERIRQAGNKIVDETGNNNLDIGFKVFKLDSSNLEKWDPDYNNIQQSLTVDNIKKDRADEDLVYEIMVKYGIDLTLPIKKHDNIYSIGFGALIVCLDNNITKDIVNKILDIIKDASVSRIVFKDNGFASDADKTNIKEILKTNHIDVFITI